LCCRIDERPIRVCEPVAAPDALIVIDPTLLHQVDVFGGLKADGFVVVNAYRIFAELGLTRGAARPRRSRAPSSSCSSSKNVASRAVSVRPGGAIGAPA
jgi:Pyruvate/2-oxoacid:ferredoxin oxidoreductase gamma subunit